MHLKFNTSVNSDYSKFLKMYSAQPFVVLIHATWCGHCQDLLAADGPWKPAVSCAELDVIEIEESIFKHLLETHPSPVLSALQQQVTGYPTLLKVKKDTRIEHFEGHRNKEDLKKFMKKPASAKKQNKSASTSASALKLASKYASKK